VEAQKRALAPTGAHFFGYSVGSRDYESIETLTTDLPMHTGRLHCPNAGAGLPAQL